MASRKSTTTGEEIPDAFILDYAPTGRAQCKKCQAVIGEGSIRVNKKVRSRFHDGFDLQLLHWRCGKDLADSLDGFVGWQRLQWQDIEKCLVAKEEELPDLTSPLVQDMRRRNQFVSEAADALAEAPLNVLKLVAESNALVFSDKEKGAQLAFVLSEQLLYGKLPSCPVCSTFSLRQEGTDVRCVGWFSASTRCTFRFRVANLLPHGPRRVGDYLVGDAEMLKRLARVGELTIPEEAAVHKVFKNFKVPKELVLNKKKQFLTTTSTAASAAASTADELLDSELENDDASGRADRLAGMFFVLISVDDEEERMNQITAHGGVVQTKIELTGKTRTTHVLVGEDVVLMDTKPATYRQAVDAGIPVVGTKFLSAILAYDQEVLFTICGRVGKARQVNGDYEPVEEFGGHPVWKKTSGTAALFVFYDEPKKKWKLNPKIGSDCGQVAYAASEAEWPWEAGTWRFFEGKDHGFCDDPEVKLMRHASAGGIALRMRKSLKRFLIDGGIGKKLPKIKDVLRDREAQARRNFKRPAPVSGSPLLTVDEEVDLKEAQIFVDGHNDAYNAYFTRTDAVSNVNKFYALQLIVYGGAQDKFAVFRKWGRVGGGAGAGKINDSLIVKHRGDRKGALVEFEKKFQELCGFRFADRDGHSQLPGRYLLVELSGQEAAENLPKKKRKIEAEDVVSVLPTPVKELIGLIFDTEMVEHEMRKEMNIDTSQLPLSALSRRQISQGLDVLKEIEKLLKDCASTENTASATLLDLRLKDASSRYFTLVPHGFDHKETVPVIRTEKLLQKEIHVLEDLLAIVDFNEVKDDAQDASKGKRHIADVQYEKLSCPLSPVSPDSSTFDWIRRYVKDTHAPTHNTYELEVVHVLGVDRGDIGNADIGNRKFLFHGSRLTNWVSILRKGMRIAPPEAPVTGYMFGKGVYFADVASKAANYCFATPDQPYGILALCDVALGEPYCKLEAEYEAGERAKASGCNSTWGVGQTAPTLEEEVETGVAAPLGKLGPNDEALALVKKQLPKEKPTLLYNEFIVYDLSQIRFKYLVLLKFNFESQRESYW